MQVEIKHLDIVSVLKVCFVLYAILGIVVGLIYVFAALILGSFLDYGDVLGEGGLLRIAATGFGILLIPLLALVYGCLGALGGLIFALIYNLISKALGGIKVSLTGETAETATGGAGGTEVRL
jgi:ABC-type multidrug transport system fused ATPase/permease subunit